MACQRIRIAATKEALMSSFCRSPAALNPLGLIGELPASSSLTVG
jgi:hypothetical protein